MARIISFEGRQISVPDDATDDEVAGILGGAAAPAETAPTSQALGFSQGVGNFLSNVAEMANGAGVPVDAIIKAISGGHDLAESTKMLRSGGAEAYGGAQPGTGGRIAADVLETLPMGLAGPFAGGAAAGALTAPDGQDKTSNAMFGGIGGKALDMGGRAVAQAIAPRLAPAVQRLREAGAQLTPGQLTGQGGLVGRAVKGLEDSASSWPLVGPAIRGAQNRSLETAGAGAINRALAPIGQELPPGVFGQDAIAHAGDALSDNYNSLLPQMSATLDAPFAQAVGGAGQRVDARLPDQMGDQFQGVLQDVFKKLASGTPGPANTFPGVAAHEAASDLGAMSRAYVPKGGNEGELGNAFGTVEGAFRDNLRRSNPQLGPQISANDEGWANLVRLEDAAKNATGNASGKAPGVFTGQQLRSAARAGDHSVRDRATARGDALMQDYAEDMTQVLPQTIGNSGTADRMLLPALAAGTLPFNAPAALAAAAVPTIYSRPGIAAINATFARPNAGPTATVLGNLVRTLSRVGGAPAVGAINGGGQ